MVRYIFKLLYVSMKKSLQSNKFSATVAIFCDIFIQDIKDFFGLNIFKK